MNFSMEMLSKTHSLPFFGRKRNKDGVEEKYWVRYKGKSYLYKKDTEARYGFGEILCSYLGQRLGFECVNVYPAKDFKSNGVIVESFLKRSVIQTFSLGDLIREHFQKDHRKRIYSVKDGTCVENTIEDLRDVEKLFAEQGVKFDQSNYLNYMKMAMVDYLLVQEDRHGYNIEFLLIKDEATGERILKLAPMFDNGRNLGRGPRGKDYMLFNPKNVAIQRFQRLIIENEVYKFEDEPEAYAVARNIAKNILKNEELKKLYKKFENIDFLYEIGTLAQYTGYCFEKRELLYITEVFNERLSMVKTALKELEVNQEIDQGREL